MPYQYTSQKEVRAAFRREFPHLDYRKIPDHSGKGKMFKADTRQQFVFFVDSLERDGQISEALAHRVTL